MTHVATDDSFARDVLEADVPVLVDFTAPWCRPCRAIEPILDELAAEYEGRLRLVLGVGVRDLTGGFKCFRREVLETIDRDAIAARGYGFQIEGTYRALRKGFAVVEVPITFVDRRVGESKMSGAIVLEAMRQVPVLRWQALRGRL